MIIVKLNKFTSKGWMESRFAQRKEIKKINHISQQMKMLFDYELNHFIQWNFHLLVAGELNQLSRFEWLPLSINELIGMMVEQQNDYIAFYQTFFLFRFKNIKSRLFV